MIPSRPLNLGDLFQETVRIFGRSIGKISLLLILFFVPVCLIVNLGVRGFVDTCIKVAIEAGFNQQDLDQKRYELRSRRHYESYQSLNSSEEKAQQVRSSKYTNSGLFHTVADTSDVLDATPPLSSEEPDTYMHDDTREPFSDKFFSRHSAEFLGSILMIALGYFLFIICSAVLHLGISDQASNTFEEREISFGGLLKNIFTRNIWRTLGLYVITILGMVGAFIAIAIFVAIGQAIGDAVAGIFMIVAYLGLIYAGIRLSMALPAIVSEDLGPIEALKRSWALTSSNIWRMIGIQIVYMFAFSVLLGFVGVIGFFALGISSLHWLQAFLGPGTMTMAEFSSGIHSFVQGILIAYEAVLALSIIIAPIFYMVLYYDLRTRLDGPIISPEDHLSNGEPPTPLWNPSVG